MLQTLRGILQRHLSPALMYLHIIKLIPTLVQMESIPPSTLLKLLLLLTIVHHFSPKSSATSDTPHLPKEALPTRSGYLKVNSTTGSSIFYTFYEAQYPNSSLSETPLLIWLQGGPGCSSMVGNFYELGPWRLSSSDKQNVEHLELKPNPGSWNRIFGLLFLDNPIGSGFSVASNKEEIPRDQNTIAKHLYVAIKKFIALDSSFKSRPFYITGESYAGKYVPSIGYYILKRNLRLPASRQMNLAGVAIGNGMSHPVIQETVHADNTYFSGWINEKQKTQLEKLQVCTIMLTKAGNWSDAANARSRVLELLQNMTGLATLYDFRRHIPYQTNLVTKFLNNVEVKKALGVGVSMVFEACSDEVSAALHEDMMKSVKYKVEYLRERSKVLLYDGQCDLRFGVVSTEAWMKMMKWDGIEKFMDSEREVWKVNEELAGYVRKWKSLSHVVVAGAGHLVPVDQAVNSQAMIEDWVLEKGLFAEKGITNLPTSLVAES